MLDYKPQKLVKYWKYSVDDQGNTQVEVISDEGNYMTFSDQYYFIWKLCDGFTTIKEVIAFFEEIFEESNSEKITRFVIEALEEMENKKLLVINWSPFG